MGGSEDLPQWLVENGENFDALLDEAKKKVRLTFLHARG